MSDDDGDYRAAGEFAIRLHDHIGDWLAGIELRPSRIALLLGLLHCIETTIAGARHEEELRVWVVRQFEVLRPPVT